MVAIIKFRERNFRDLLESAKTAKIMHLENLDVYGNLLYSARGFQKCSNFNLYFYVFLVLHAARVNYWRGMEAVDDSPATKRKTNWLFH